MDGIRAAEVWLHVQGVVPLKTVCRVGGGGGPPRRAAGGGGGGGGVMVCQLEDGGKV